MKRYLFISLGILSIALGTLGIIVPVLPTTPFMLLSAWLFAKSSKRLNFLLLHNKVFGKYIKDYVERKPIPIRRKVVSIAFLWAGIGTSLYFATLKWWIIVLLLVIGVAVSLHIATLGRCRKTNS
ncbi:MAG: YbaN family protein [Bacteroidales bacterium]|jgi:uncharacterized membrane protein YbaN (DUF454 family)|nr:YbaN family protein [Bacteroidales bacterium]